MEPSLKHTLTLLDRMPAAFSALLGDLPETFTLADEGPYTWNAHDVIGHLIHCERADWLPRARHILAHGQSQPFPPFDRLGHIREMHGKSLAQLLDEFAHMRAVSLSDLADLNLQPADLDRLGTHPAFGAVTLAQLLSAWAAHDLTHLHQLSRVLASPFRQAVGPWSRNLGVLNCEGHSTAA
ncbi:MAG TPA: DinB family protein [Terracidiphilus sp.]|nr:DinB family protein [Terracidiphilus sp.]